MTPDEHWALWRRDPHATPFQSPAWIEPWWANLGGGERIDLEARDAGGRLVGCLPAFIWVDGTTRRLVPLGAGTSDYSDALLDPAEPAALNLLLEAIDRQRERWDELLLPDLRPGSPLAGALPPGWTASDEAHETCPVLALPPAAEPLLPALNKTIRRKVVHDRHRADRLGGVTTALAAPHEIGEALDALFALHAARWQAAGEAGVLADPKVQGFHRAAAPALAEAGLLRMAVVRHEGRIVAVLYGFSDGARGHSYINGVAMDVAGQSFGTLAFACLIEAAQREGKGEFHFLRGEEGYKYMWGAEPTRTTRRTVRKV